MKRAAFLSVLFFLISQCSNPSTPNKETRRVSGTMPLTNIKMVMTSTGKVASSLAKIKAGKDFSRPVGTWRAGATLNGCPDYVDLTMYNISAHGYFLTREDTVFDSVGINNGVHVNDTIVIPHYDSNATLWSGSKTIRFDGNSADLSNFDSLKIPPGSMNQLTVSFSPTVTVKGSITGRFSFSNAFDDTGVLKTYYTKQAYLLNIVSNAGGSADPTVFEQGPAEETRINIVAGWNPDFSPPQVGFNTPCTTVVTDSTKLTMLFDISRVLEFFDGDSVWGSGLNGAPNNRAYFAVEDGFSHMQILSAFADRIGVIEGYAIKTDYNLLTVDADTTGLAIVNDTTYGSTGWMTLIFNAHGALIQGLSTADSYNNSFCPGGLIKNYSAGYFETWVGDSSLVGGCIVSGFVRGAALGNSCQARFTQPSSEINGQHFLSRMGEAQYTLQLIQH